MEWLLCAEDLRWTWTCCIGPMPLASGCMTFRSLICSTFIFLFANLIHSILSSTTNFGNLFHNQPGSVPQQSHQIECVCNAHLSVMGRLWWQFCPLHTWWDGRSQVHRIISISFLLSFLRSFKWSIPSSYILCNTRILCICTPIHCGNEML